MLGASPAGWAFLAALGWASCAFAGPTIFWASDPVGPDDAVLVLGADLTDARVEIEDLGAGAGSPRKAEVAQDTASAFKFIIPSNMSRSVYRYTVTTRTGRATGYLNAPTIYWTQGDQGASAQPGGWVRVLGRNIGRSGAAVLTLSHPGRSPTIIHPTSYDLWNATFPVPPDLAPGKYALSINNGEGGPWATREAGVLTVTLPEPRARRVVNVREKGAVGNGAQDDSPVIGLALRTVGESGGGTVFLPRGYYRLTAPLRIPPGVALKGEGREMSHLVWAETESPPTSLVEAGSDTEISDLTIVSGRHIHVISAGMVGGGEPARNVAIRRVTIRASGFFGHITAEQTGERIHSLQAAARNLDTLQLSGENIVVEDCDVLGTGRSLFLFRASHARITGNKFYNGRFGWYSITAADGVIFENNNITGADLQSTGGGVNTLGGQRWSQNVLFKNNTFDRTLGWDGEALTTDGPGGYYYGSAISRTIQTVELADSHDAVALRDLAGSGLFVTGGTGVGEVARVLSSAGRTVELDRPLPVALDVTSVITITPYQANYLIVGNHFADARVAAQIFGVSLDHVIAGNTSTRTGGFADQALVYRGVQPSWRTQILDNEITEGSLWAPASIQVKGRQAAPSTTPVNYGTIVRGNHLLSNAYISMSGVSPEYPGLADAIVEHNRIQKSDHGVVVDAGAVRVLLRDNSVGNAR
jgi:hypothetical protein